VIRRGLTGAGDNNRFPSAISNDRPTEEFVAANLGRGKANRLSQDIQQSMSRRSWGMEVSGGWREWGGGTGRFFYFLKQ
jgi:hypothetical protein